MDAQRLASIHARAPSQSVHAERRPAALRPRSRAARSQAGGSANVRAASANTPCSSAIAAPGASGASSDETSTSIQPSRCSASSTAFLKDRTADRDAEAAGSETSGSIITRARAPWWRRPSPPVK
eukprot:scaffold100381_cov66-Phaeocystis_antarctica.AAC.10